MNNQSKFWPWKVSLFLLFSTMISYLDRQAFSFAGPVIQEEMGLDNEQLGTLLSAFFLAYGIMHFSSAGFSTDSILKKCTPFLLDSGRWHKC